VIAKGKWVSVGFAPADEAAILKNLG
jgi:hypothetical protein